MTQYDNSNSFALFKNDKKGNEKAPNSKGPGEVTCQHCGEVNRLDFAGWTRTTRAGEPMISGKIQPQRAKDDKPKTEKKAAPVYKGSDEPNDEIPF